MTTKRATDLGEWVQLIVRPTTNSYITGTWHRHDGEATLCGFKLFDRAIHGKPPPGARHCRFCLLAAADG